MKIKWIALAEGLGQDSRGALTLIAVNQNILATENLPANIKRAVLVHLSDDDKIENTDKEILVNITVKSPSERAITAQTVSLRLQKKTYEDLPGTGDVPAEFIVTIQEYGTYTFTVEITNPDGSVERGEEYLYVTTTNGSL